MDERNPNDKLELSVLLHNFAKTAKRLLWLPLALGLLAGGLSWFRADRAYTPSYTAGAVFSVNAGYSASTDILSSSAYLDSNAAVQLAATFPYIISSESTQLLLKQALRKDFINGSIRASSIADAALFTLNVASSSPQDAYDILYAVIAVYPQAASTILGDTQIQIIDQPLAPPTTPTNGNTALSTGIKMGLLGFAVGLAVIFLLSLTRKTICSSDDLRKLVNLPCLAHVPSVPQKKRSRKDRGALLLTNEAVNADYSESIRNLRVKLQKQAGRSGARVIVMTSTLPGEGKSTIATNLALSLAAGGKRVILIDGDLRKQSLKPLLGIHKKSDGLVEVLSCKAQNFRLLPVPGSSLMVLSGDSTTNQPQTLLDSHRMRQILELLRQKLDFIIIDAPPAGILSDAATIAKHADGVVYVVRQDLASSAQIINSIQTLSSGGANLLGCVLNRTQAGHTRYGAKYGSKYGYGYRSKYYGYDSASVTTSED